MTKNEARQRRKIRIRKKISGTAERPRLVIFRSNLHMYAQVVDDLTGATLAATSTLVLSKGGEKVSCNKAGAEAVGKEIARLAKEKSIEKVVFDRNGYLYHGKIKAVGPKLVAWLDMRRGRWRPRRRPRVLTRRG